MHCLFSALMFCLACPASGFPVTLTDATGVQVTVARRPERIVSLAPSLTECLFALGLGPRLVGVTRFCDYPEAAKTKVRVGGFVDFSTEKILSLSPHLVFAVRGNSRTGIDQLRRLGVPLFTFETQTLDHVILTLETMGRLTGQTGESDAVVKSFHRAIDRVQRRLAGVPRDRRPKVYFGGYRPPFFSPGKDTFQNDLIELAGGRNIARDAAIRWPQLSMERIVKDNPDVIVYATGEPMRQGEGQAMIRHQFRSRKEWQHVAAVQSNRIYVLDGDAFARPGPRLREALLALAACLHPEKLKSPERQAP